MNIVVVARMRDSQEYLPSFIERYSFADSILLADGGSKDLSVGIALRHGPKVKVRRFNERVIHPDDPTIWRNPEGKHINFLLDWADEEAADWVILDDIDCYPNVELFLRAREILESNAEKDAVFVYRLYLWLDQGYFPQLNRVGQSVWAWQPPRTRWRANEDDFVHYSFPDSRKNPKRHLLLDYPLCLLHRSWPTEEAALKKMQTYWYWGHKQLWPPDSCGPIEPLPEWAR